MTAGVSDQDNSTNSVEQVAYNWIYELPAGSEANFDVMKFLRVNNCVTIK